MYEQSYCSLFYDQCSFCFMMFAPKRDIFIVSMTSSSSLDSDRCCCCAIGLSFFDRLFYRNRVFFKLSV